MPRGGRRSGSPGQSYANRSDLATQPVRTAPSQQYGQAVAQQRAQQAIPLPAAAPVPASPVPATPSPPDPGMLHAPTTRPGEPVTAGLPVGAGPGPEAMAGTAIGTNIDNDLRTLYRLFPIDAVRQIVERSEGRNAVP